MSAASRRLALFDLDHTLLERVREPVVTNGDDRLLALAAERGWRTISLRPAAGAQTA